MRKEFADWLIGLKNVNSADRRRKKRRVWLVLAIVALTVCLSLAVSAWISADWLKTTHYSIPLRSINGTFKIVFLSDLHGRSFGNDNQTLLRQIEKEQPDIIAMTGDMLPSAASAEDVQQLCRLIASLQATAPVYVSLGNTEKAYLRENGQGLLEELRQTDAVVLEETWVQLTINGATVRLGGMYEYAFAHHNTPEEWAHNHTYLFLKDFCNTQATKIMLCHRPDGFVFSSAYQSYDIDLYLCGHTHGGIIRFPFLGGLTATDQGWFPEYDYGQYRLDDAVMVITSGFAGHDWIPRFNNRPEIASVTITGEP